MLPKKPNSSQVLLKKLPNPEPPHSKFKPLASKKI